MIHLRIKLWSILKDLNFNEIVHYKLSQALGVDYHSITMKLSYGS